MVPAPGHQPAGERHKQSYEKPTAGSKAEFLSSGLLSLDIHRFGQHVPHPQAMGGMLPPHVEIGRPCSIRVRLDMRLVRG